MLSFSDLKLGSLVNIEGQPYQIVWQSHVHTGRGKAVLQTKLKNLITGSVLENSFKDGDKIEEADVVRKKAQFLYFDKDEAFFMINDNYETIGLSEDKVGEARQFLKEGLECMLILFEGTPVKVDLPIKADYKVSSTVPGVKGDTATGGTKPATIETGAQIQVPLFIGQGDVIKINTETGEYVERV